MVKKGERIHTDFTLNIVRDGEEEEVTFSSLLDKPTIVSVYMRNNTPGCDNQNKSLAQHQDRIKSKGYNLIALSKDSCGSHKNYVKNFDIDYILASDPDYKFARATDSLVEKKMFGNTFDAPTRSAYLLDTNGTVLDYIKKIDTKNHAEELLELIDSQNQKLPHN